MSTSISTAAFNLLAKAYEYYSKTSNYSFSYQMKNADDMFYSMEAAKELHDMGYIKNVSDFVFEESNNDFFEPITFDLTFTGIEYMRLQREL